VRTGLRKEGLADAELPWPQADELVPAANLLAPFDLSRALIRHWRAAATPCEDRGSYFVTSRAQRAPLRATPAVSLE